MTTEELSLKIDSVAVDLSLKIDQVATTVDNLAISMAKGFQGMEEKFDKRFDSVEGRLTKVEDKLDKVENKLTKVEGKAGILQEVLRVTRQDVLNLGDKFVSYKQFDHLTLRVSTLEGRP